MKLSFIALSTFFSLAAPAVAHAQSQERTLEACIADADGGQALRNAGKLLDARRTFTTCSNAECPAAIREQCTQWSKELATELAVLTVRVVARDGSEVASERVDIDDKPVRGPVELDPGPHVVRVTLPGVSEPISQSVVLKRGERKTLEVAAFKDEPAASGSPPPRPQEMIWVGYGLSAAALLGGVAMAFSAKSQVDDMRDGCAPYCRAADITDAKTTAFVADVLFVASAVGAVLSTVFLVSAPASRSSTSHARR